MSTKQLLMETRAIVAAGWTQHAYRDGNAYCLVGALSKAANTEPADCLINQEIWRALCVLQRHMSAPYHVHHPATAATEFNDNNTQQAVLNLLDKVIAA